MEKQPWITPEGGGQWYAPLSSDERQMNPLGCMIPSPHLAAPIEQGSR